MWKVCYNDKILFSIDYCHPIGAHLRYCVDWSNFDEGEFDTDYIEHLHKIDKKLWVIKYIYTEIHFHGSYSSMEKYIEVKPEKDSYILERL